MAISKLKSVRSVASGFARGALVKWAAVALIAALPAQAMAVDSAFLRSLLIPGSGQAQNGHYTRAAIYGGAAVLSGFGLIVAEVFYLESVDKFEAQREAYLSYDETLEEGGVVSIDDLEDTYAQMVAEHDTADRRLAWRNGFAIALATTYVVNLVDVLLSKPYEPDSEERISVEPAPGGVRITKMFRF